jgi:hypothetical protein
VREENKEMGGVIGSLGVRKCRWEGSSVIDLSNKTHCQIVPI